MKKKSGYLYLVVAILFLFGGVYGQNKFEGYSVVVQADNGGACPVWYLPSAGNGNAVEVFIAGTDQRTPAAELSACDGSSVYGQSGVFPNSEGHWCFNGPEPFYDVKFRSGAVYLWYPINKDLGFYNVKDFRPVTRTNGPSPQYSFIDPPDIRLRSKTP
jgi:hypothetical protein